MRLKRLELFGFKSFADRTVLDFRHELTGIVGPNGCGKSNVVDAIRWSLGEQRAKSMRGGEMTDVIFKGSSSRPAMGVAEVTLVIDNQGEELEGRGAEVSISRRVYKSGEGEYLIDGERCRLKDVRDMLFDTGLGSRGYAVLEQGKIDAILSANPLERRAIFEEAAGISRYRQRKHEAENKLKRVERDLERLEDVTRELSTRSRSLKIQAGKAERFLVARDSWREQATSYSRHRVFDLDRSLERVRDDIGGADARVVELRELREGGEGTIRERDLERTALEGEVGRATSRSSEISSSLSALDERKVQLSARVAGWRHAAEEEMQRAEGMSSRLAERHTELDGVSSRAAELDGECERARGHLVERQSTLAGVRQALREIESQFEGQNERVLGLLHEKTGAENEVVRLERTIEPLGERLKRSELRARDVGCSRQEARSAVWSARIQLDRAETTVADLDRRREHLDGEARALETRSRELFEKKSEGELERASLESKIESLLDREAERGHLDAGSRALLQGEADELGVEIRGLVADHLRTETRFARALDGALGERAEALVVSSGSEADRILSWLKEGERGRARLVLPGGIGRPAPLHPEELSHVPGVLGTLLSVVRVEPGYEELASALLAGAVVVEDVPSAFTLVSRAPHLLCVTLDGDCVDAAGVLGGYREVTHGPVGRRASAAELAAEADALARRTNAIGAELASMLERRDVLQEGAREALAALDEARGVLGDARGAAESARIRLADAEEAVQMADLERDELERERSETQRALVTSGERCERLVAEFQRENQRLQDLTQARRVHEKSREDLAREEAQARVEDTRLAEQLQAARRREADIVRACGELEEERDRGLSQSERHTNDANEGEARFGEIDASREELLAERGDVAGLLQELRAREQAAREAMESLRSRIDEVTRELEEQMNALSEVQLEEQRLSLSRDELLRRAEEDLGLSVEELGREFSPEAELLEEGALDALEAEIIGLRHELDRLGSVNLEAVEELEEVTTRLTFLEEQRGDVIRARAALHNTLKTINEESERLFLEAFYEVRQNFERLFRQLFGGGKATIELAPDEPVLEAGIQISARPPGREMLPLGLLSGGQRTMTALGLLFAVFQSRPSPFCVLDEVDAALDDANIGRFLVLLEGFLDSTQFVVVTHNKGTMSACRELYGITMETRGVSRQVSVELSDVDDFVPEVAGDAAKAQEARRELVEASVNGDENGDVVPGPELDAETHEPVVELVPLDPGSLAAESPLEPEPEASTETVEVTHEELVREP